MLMYFIDTYEFVSNCTYNKKYSIKEKLKRTTVVADIADGDDGPANLCISVVPVYKYDDSYDNIYLSFGEDGNLINCKTYFDYYKGVFVIYDSHCGDDNPEKEPEKEALVEDTNKYDRTKELEIVEEAFNDILSSIKALQTAITNLHEEVCNKFEELNKLKRGSDD